MRREQYWAACGRSEAFNAVCEPVRPVATASACSTCRSPRESIPACARWPKRRPRMGFWELMRIARWHVEGEAYDRALSPGRRGPGRAYRCGLLGLGADRLERRPVRSGRRPRRSPQPGQRPLRDRTRRQGERGARWGGSRRRDEHRAGAFRALQRVQLRRHGNLRYLDAPPARDVAGVVRTHSRYAAVFRGRTPPAIRWSTAISARRRS